MQWTDRIRQVKIILVVAAVLISVASLFISQYLVRDLSIEERHKMEVWAEAMRSLNNADENTDLNLVLKVIDGNNTIPVIVLDKEGAASTFRNISIEGKDYEDSLRCAAEKGQAMLKAGNAVKIYLDENGAGDFINVCYDDSVMIKRLQSWPYIQLGIVMVFVVVAIFALLTSKRAEQNKVWVGLSKETAHQLGTPISSLMAWTEILKETYPDDDLLPEMDQDVRRLQLIADRFSKIGSMPELTPTNLSEVMEHVVDYMNRRTSSKVHMRTELPKDDIIANINPSLFEWVIENLCKNAVDAMEGEGSITLHLERMEGKSVVVRTLDIGGDKELPYLELEGGGWACLSPRGLWRNITRERFM